MKLSESLLYLRKLTYQTGLDYIYYVNEIIHNLKQDVSLMVDIAHLINYLADLQEKDENEIQNDEASKLLILLNKAMSSVNNVMGINPTVQLIWARYLILVTIFEIADGHDDILESIVDLALQYLDTLKSACDYTDIIQNFNRDLLTIL